MSAQAASVYDNMPPAPILAPSWQEREDLRRRLLDTMQPGMLAALGAKDFDVFSSTVMPEAFYQPSSIFHRHLTNVVSVNQMTGRREIAVGPRGWGKSTTVTEGGTLWVVARNQYIPLSQRYKFILIVSDTTTQAEARLAVIKSNLETNEKIEQLYPDIYGKGPLWRAEMIVTRNDVCIATAGMNTSIRGTRYKNRRPDLILCHERGTMMEHGGQWIPVEQHPSFKEYRVCSGVEIAIHGIPEPEIVTPEHRYWACKVIPAKNGHTAPVVEEPAWVEAENLTKQHYIGTPIDNTVIDVYPKAKTYVPGNGSLRDDAGRLVGGGGVWRMLPMTFLEDPEMWFVIGLWWGDGSVHGRAQSKIVFNRRDIAVAEKAVRILSNNGITGTIADIPTEENMLALHIHHTQFTTFLREWKKAPSRKEPPRWVENIKHTSLIELIKGYVSADGWVNTHPTRCCARITSIHLPGLYAVQRMLAKLGITSSVRKGAKPRKEKFPNSLICWSQQKYDIHFRNGVADIFGYAISDQARYRTQKQFISDGFVWRAVKSVLSTDEREFCPIQTDTHTYITAFGLSHNCDDPDDLDSANSPTLSRDKEERFTRDLLKCGHAKTDVLVVGTIISKMCLAYKLLYSDDFAAWNGTLFKALQEFPERMDLWNQWGDIIKDRTISNRAAKAMVFYRNNKEEMDKGGQSNWPEVYPVRNLMYEYYTEGRKSFLTEKQNQIIEADARHFQLEKYRFVGPDEYKRYMSMNPIMYMYIDPSGGASASSKKLLNLRGPDKFSATIIAKLSPRLYLLVAQTSKQCRQSAQFEEIAKLLQKYNVFRITSEDNAGQTHYTEGLKKFLTEKYADKDWVEMARLQGGTTHLILPRGVTNLVAKEERISMLEPYLDNFTLLLREDMNKDFRGLNDEFEDWPNSEFDDCLDSLSGAFFSAFRTFQLSYLLH